MKHFKTDKRPLPMRPAPVALNAQLLTYCRLDVETFGALVLPGRPAPRAVDPTRNTALQDPRLPAVTFEAFVSDLLQNAATACGVPAYALLLPRVEFGS